MTAQQAIVLVLQASILMTVFGFGLRATLTDVSYIMRRPSLLGRSLVAMFVTMPIVAVALARVFALPPAVEIALVALSISPIPPLLPGREQQAGGHQSYALGLMVITGVLSVVFVPAAVAILGRYLLRPFAMSSVAIARVVLLMSVLPLAAGLLCHAMWPAVAARIAKANDLIAKVLLVIGVVALLAGVLPSALALAGNGAIVAMAVFVVAGLAIGHWLGGPETDQRTVLALSTASRHPAIAFAIAKANFPDEPYLGAALVLFLLVNLLVGIPYQVRQKRRAAAAISGSGRRSGS
jgi:bile acid:Na+ symporter, BASS family